MAVVKINAIEVAAERGAELEERFARRASEVEKMPGFLGFELLRPVGGETRYFVYTRWESEEAYQAWRSSTAFTRGHAQAARDRREAPVAQSSSLLEFEVVQEVATARLGP
ncbi:MAG TPA: antibiotic biosynthesis monooxygenase [Solirubrobacteraceae bacterium]|jgi:heme-degrading monooxygenase HmoA|nr:antibiotic biosynthesis monooxygenase [Solirubrobacteraceae bacterium]